MSWAINNQPAPDLYTADATLELSGLSRGLDHINVDVAGNSGIYRQLKLLVDPDGREGLWSAEVYQAPGSRSLFRRGLVGIRFRAATPAAGLPIGAAQATVTIEAVPR